MNSNNNNILSALISAFNPEILAFYNKVIMLQKNCPMVEWPYCKLYNTLCNGQCTFKTNDCPCDTGRSVKWND